MIHVDESIIRELKSIIIESSDIMGNLLGDTIVSFKRIPRVLTRINNVLDKMEDKERKANEKT